MRISLKLIASFLAVSVVIALLGLFSHLSNREIERRLNVVEQLAAIGIADAAAMTEALQNAHVAAYSEALLSKEPPDFQSEPDDTAAEPAAGGTGIDDEEFHRSPDLQRHFDAFQRSLERSYHATYFAQNWSRAENPAARRRHEEMLLTLGQLQREFDDHRALLQTVSNRRTEDAAEVLAIEIEPHYRRQLHPRIETFQRQAQAEFSRNLLAVDHQLARAQWQNMLLSIFAILASIGLGLGLSRAIVRPLSELKTAAEQVGRGDFDIALHIRSRDELAVLAEAFSHMGQRLRETMVSRDRLESSLREKEILLREVHHRVKNNLQIVSSFLRLQASDAADPQFEALLVESQNRIRSMARIHELLHESKDLSTIDIRQYVQDLCDNVARTYQRPEEELLLDVQADAVHLPLDVAIPCGMIMNELISNSLKHAFPQPNHPRRVAAIYRVGGQRHTLGVVDNGQGFAETDGPGGPHGAATASLGLKVVAALARQLHGEVEISSEQGTSIMVTYPAPQTEPK